MIHLEIDAHDISEMFNILRGIFEKSGPDRVMNIPHPQGSIDVVTEQPVTEQPQPDAPKRHRRTKAEMEAAKNAEAQPQSAPAQAAVAENTVSEPAASPPAAEDVGDAAQAAPALTLEAVREKLKAVNAAKGMDEVKRILAAHGLQKVSAITEDKFAAIAAEADKVLA